MKKELSLAFIWHFHQPNYQTQPGGIRLMPWARLHAVKDYLDMLKIIDKFPNIKLNFSIVPALIDTIEDYARDAHDIHSKLTVTPAENLTDDDKLYILNYFFDVNYENLISKNPRYNELYQKRYSSAEIGINDFSLQDYADIMTLFNLLWFDPVWFDEYPLLRQLEQKGRNYTLDDRQQLIELNRVIIRQIIPSFKKYLEEGRIEIITSPYNHPIMPILVNSNDIKVPSFKYPMPECKISMVQDVKEQLKLAFEKIKDTFGVYPNGIWPSEHFISQKTLDTAANSGAEWIVTDESVLSNSLKKEFERDFRGYYKDPYDVCSLYYYKTKLDKEINIIFRGSSAPNLISFEYPHHDSISGAEDLFERIKSVYDKLKNSPDKNHLLTIAMDGENSWDIYPKDGRIFLEHLYSLINDDKSIKTVLVSDYIKKNKKERKLLEKVKTGSCMNQEFQLWIAEPAKNLAWEYLVKTRNELMRAAKAGELSKEQLQAAKSEIYIAEGSDWFWWYGEPNNSGQDHIFDFMFREHLKNVYNILGKPVPDYLETPLAAFIGKPFKNPAGKIKPLINGISRGNTEWQHAGCIDIPAGPILQENKLFNRIYFGNDDNNLYLRFDINKYMMESKESFKEYFSIYIYFKTGSHENTSPVRTSNKADTMLPVLKDSYTHEVKFALTENRKYPIQFSKSVNDGLWQLNWNHGIRYIRKEILEAAVPFDDLGVNKGESFEFFFIAGCSGVTEEIYPKDIPLSITRPV